jgi:hypothetical protein
VLAFACAAALSAPSAAFADETPAAAPPAPPAQKAPVASAPAAASALAPAPPPTEEPSMTWSLSGGRASFPLLDDGDALVVEAHLAVFAQYVLSIRNEATGTEWFHDFELPRAHATLAASFEGAHGRVTVEGFRSASEGALVGVAGDSFVLRLREAWADYVAWDALEMRLGLLPTMTIGPIEEMWGMRMVAPTGLERTALASPVDLGATVRGFLPLGLGWVGAGAYNGEGYDRRELNRGKNIEIATLLHPFSVVRGAEPITVSASYVSGSSGIALARADRVTAGIAWEGDVLRGGAAFTYAWGVRDAGEQESMLAEGFVRVRPIERLDLGVDTVAWFRDRSDPDDWIVTITGAAGYFIVDPLGVFVAVDGQLFGPSAEQALPGLDDARVRVITSIQF